MLNSPLPQIEHILNKLPVATRQTGYLVAIDSITNLVDYAFHVFLGRALLPAEFAIVQTINAVLLVLVTAFSVVEPVIARQIVEAGLGQDSHLARLGVQEQWRAIFQRSFLVNGILGVLLFVLIWVNRQTFAGWLQVPIEVIPLGAVVLLFALLRPVISGTLQGHRRFIAFGLTRSMYAFGRLTAAVILVSLGAGLMGAVSSFPLGSLLAVIGGLLMIGPTAWKTWKRIPKNLPAKTIRLSAGAFVAYGGYMTLLNSDLIWIKHAFAPHVAGNYAAAVLLRRVLLLLPGAVIVVMYPRAVEKYAQKRLPDRLLFKTAAAIIGITSLFIGLYFVFGNPIVQLAFGDGYESAGPVLGWMGLGILGYSLTAVWMNFYLATRPLPYVILLGIGALLQNHLLAYFHNTILQVITIFAWCGWILAVGGLLLYLIWLRPIIEDRTSKHEQRFGF